MSEKRYALKWKLDIQTSKEGFTKQEINPEVEGACDAFVLVSILRGGKKAHEGSTSQQIITYDGHNPGKGIPDTELFTHWSMLAKVLSEEMNVPQWQKEIALEAFEKIRKIVSCH